MTYARARLWLGIAGVGTMVTLSAIALATDLPSRLAHAGFLNGRGEWVSLAAFAGLYIVLSFPFDFLGGYWLPCRFHRQCQLYPLFLFSWLRGVLTQGAVFAGSALAILFVGRAAGRGGAILLVGLLMAAMLAMQNRLTQLVGGVTPVETDAAAIESQLKCWGVALPRLSFVGATDSGFLGGPAGWPGKERLLAPASWTWSLRPESAAATLVRRLGVINAGSRFRGVLLAFAWNLAGFAAATFLPRAGVTTAAQVIHLSLYFTLWSFLGLLLLPTLSRRGVLEADRYALEAGVPLPVLEQSIREVDQLQDDEPARHPWVEAIFHPIPAVSNRLRALRQAAPPPRGAWQAARLALFLSWACLGLLSHAVHCNSGRPELWVLLPAD